MDPNKLEVFPIHEHPEFMKQCCDLINDEWSRSETARMNMLLSSNRYLPTSLVLVENRKTVLGHCKMTRIPSIPDSCFLESVVISKAHRGQKLGTYLMKKVEEYGKKVLHLKMMHLSTKGQENFYFKLGYRICEPISIYGLSMPSIFTSPVSSAIKTNVPVKSSNAVGPPPPPAPPMPENLPTIRSLKVAVSKTYMCKEL